jgi:hypothetical protein
LGRLTEAVEAVRASLATCVKLENWTLAARIAGNLSEDKLTLGDLPGAVQAAEQSVAYADRRGDTTWPRLSRTNLADVLHQTGRRAEAEAHFGEAERMQAERHLETTRVTPQRGATADDAVDFTRYPLLHRVRGFWYCDLLLAGAERAAWQVVFGSEGVPSTALAIPSRDATKSASFNLNLSWQAGR